MVERMRTMLGSPWTVGALAVTLIVSLALNGVALAGDRGAGDRAALEGRIASLEASFGDLEDGQRTLLELLFEFQQGFTDVAPTVRQDLDAAGGELDAFRGSTLSFPVPIREQIRFATEIPLQRTLDVEIDTVLPIDETFDTTISIDGPFGIDIPLNVTVPVRLDLPINLTVPLAIDETVPVAADVPVDLTIPVDIVVADTDLILLVDGLQAMVGALTSVLDSLGG